MKKHIASLISIAISLPLLALIGYFFYSFDFNITTLFTDNIGYLENTFIVTIGTFLGVVILGTVSAFIQARYDYFGKRIFGVLFVLPLAFPAYVLGYTYVGLLEYKGVLFELFGLGVHFDILNIYGVMFIFSLAMYPYVYILARVSFASMSSSVDELMRLHNFGDFKAFFYCYLPLAYPAIFAGGILSVMETLSDYGTVLYFGVETLSVGIFKSWFGYANLVLAIGSSILLLIFIFALLLSESYIRQKFRFVTTTQSSQKAISKKVGIRASIGLFFTSLFIVLLSLILPMIVLFYWFYIDFDALDLTLLDNLVNTFKLNIIASLMIVSLSFLMIFLMRMYPSRFANISAKIAMLGYSIPGAVVAIGVLIISTSIDNYLGQMVLGSSIFLLIFAYMSRYYAASVGAIENGFSKIDRSIDEANKIFGLSKLKNFFMIYVPLMSPYLISGFLILYIDIAKELPATLLLRPFNYDTIAIKIFEMASNETLYKVAFPSLMLVLTTMIAVVLLQYRFKKGKK